MLSGSYLTLCLSLTNWKSRVPGGKTKGKTSDLPLLFVHGFEEEESLVDFFRREDVMEASPTFFWPMVRVLAWMKLVNLDPCASNCFF